MKESSADAFELDYKTDVNRIYELFTILPHLLETSIPGVLALGTPVM
jgi:hypothetical protein